MTWCGIEPESPFRDDGISRVGGFQGSDRAYWHLTSCGTQSEDKVFHGTIGVHLYRRWYSGAIIADMGPSSHTDQLTWARMSRLVSFLLAQVSHLITPYRDKSRTMIG
jgi:hypothetical protein